VCGYIGKLNNKKEKGMFADKKYCFIFAAFNDVLFY
jgi:hypothetical protein